MEAQTLIDKKNNKIIYDEVQNNHKKTIIFLSGLKSDRKATKASFFKKYAIQNHYHYICFDYAGHGDSDLEFQDCNIDIWLENIKEIIENLAKKEVVLIGSSLGAWLGLKIAELMPDKISAFIGISSAPDFTEDLWRVFSDEVKKKLEKGEIYNLSSKYCEGEYPITLQLIESGRINLLLKAKEININKPVRLFHSMQDEDVDYNYSIKIMEKLTSKDAELKLFKDGNHSLSDEKYLVQIIASLNKFL